MTSNPAGTASEAQSLQSPLPAGTLVPQTAPSLGTPGVQASAAMSHLSLRAHTPQGQARQVIQIVHPELQTLPDPGDSEGGDPGEGPGVP